MSTIEIRRTPKVSRSLPGRLLGILGLVDSKGMREEFGVTYVGMIPICRRATLEASQDLAENTMAVLEEIQTIPDEEA